MRSARGWEAAGGRCVECKGLGGSAGQVRGVQKADGGVECKGLVHKNSEVRSAWPENSAWLTTFPVVTHMQT